MKKKMKMITTGVIIYAFFISAVQVPLSDASGNPTSSMMEGSGSGVEPTGSGDEATTAATGTTDIDECMNDMTNCDENAVCSNTIGSFTCECKAGYTGNGKTCSDLDGCVVGADNCGMNGMCTNVSGTFTCQCKNGYEGDGMDCTAKPTLSTLPSVLSVTDSCISILVDESLSHVSYLVKFSSDTSSFSNSTNMAILTVCGLLPNTEYSVVAGVLQDTSGGMVFDEPVFTTSILARTDFKRLHFAVTLTGVNFIAAFYDITSTESINLIARYKGPLLEQFNDGTFTLTLRDVSIVGLREGSTIASVEGTTNSTDPAADETDVSGAFSSSANFSDPVTIRTPSTPTISVSNSDVGTDSAFVNFTNNDDRNVIQYEVEVSCDNDFNSTIFTNESEATLMGLPQNSICNVKVRVQIETSNTTAFSSFSDPETFTTDFQFNVFETSVTGSSLRVEFENFKRLDFYEFNVTNEMIGGAEPQSRQVFAEDIPSGNRVIASRNDLLTNTSYRIDISVSLSDHEGTVTSKTETRTVTTASVTTVSDVTVIDVRDTSFQVTYTAVPEAIEYTIETYLDGEVVNTTMSVSTSATVSGVRPDVNEYLVAVAYNTPARSAFSENVTTKRWDFTNIGQTGFTVNWISFPSTSIYQYTVTNPDGSSMTDNTVQLELNITDRMPGSVYLVEVESDDTTTSPGTIIGTKLFAIFQITLPSPPSLNATSRSIDNNGDISWEAVRGADNYDISVTLSNTGSAASDVDGTGITTDTNVTLSNLTNGVSYSVEICSLNSAGRSCATVQISGPLAQPDDPQVGMVAQTTVEVSYAEISGAISHSITVLFENETLVTIIENAAQPLTVMDLTPGTRYRFAVIAIYETGNATSNFVTQITAPANPTNLAIEDVDTRSVNITWVVGIGVNSSVVSLSNQDGTPIIENFDVGENKYYQNSDLLPGVRYNFTVRTRNAGGDSEDENLEFQTVPDAPTGLNYTEVTQTSINVTFQESTGAEMYNLTINPDGTSVEISNTNYQFTGLSAGTEHQITVVAVSPTSATPQGELRSSPSELMVTTAPPDVSNVMVTSRSPTSLDITFDLSLGATSYRVEYEPSGMPITETVNNSSLTGLESGTAYNITVIALNRFGQSGNSGIATNEFTRSVSPNGYMFRDFTTNSFVVTWQEQSGAADYQVNVVLTDGSVPPGLVISRNGLQANVSGLSPGTEYNVSVQTVDAFGPRDAEAVETEITIPDQPTGLRIVTHTNSSLDFEWDLVKGASSYRVIVNQPASGGILLDNTTPELLFSSGSILASGEQYEISVFAENRNGFGMAATLTDYTISDPFPGRVIFDGNTETSIRINHTSVPGVVIHTVIAVLNGLEIATCNSTGSACDLTGLSSGLDYNISVKGVHSSESVTQPGQTELFTTRPAMPANVFIVPEDFSLNVTYNPVVGASFYTFELVGVDTETSTEPTIKFSSLDSGMEYTIRATATKETDYGNFTSEVAETILSTTQAIPTGVTVSDITPDQFVVTWDAIQGATQYKVAATPVDTDLLTVRQNTVAAETTVTITGLSAGKVYNVTVGGVYSTGEGEPSEVKQQITAPATPTNLEVMTVAIDYITLTWDEVPTAIQYRVMFNGENKTFPEEIANITGLTAGTVYTLTVVALNEMLESVRSDELNQITVPASPIFMMSPAVTQTTVMLIWNNPPGTNDFVVELTRGMDSVVSEEITETSVLYTSANGIDVGTNYTFCVQARTINNTDSVGQQQTSKEMCINVTTDPGNTTNIMELSTTFNSITFNWTEAEGASYYEVSATLESNTTQRMAQNVSAGTTTTIDGLLPGANYVLSVTPFNHLGAMSFEFGEVVVQTNPLSPNVDIEDVTTNSLSVTWSVTSGTILTIIRIRRADLLPTEAGIVIEEDGEFFPRLGEKAGITGLSPGLTYNITVTSFTLKKKSEASVFIFITVPSNPTNFQLLERTSSSIRIGWDNVTGADTYVTTLAGPGFSNSQETESAAVTFVALSASENYTATVFAKNSGGNSTESTFTSSTTPETPLNVRSVSSNRSIEILYDSAEGATSYAIVGTSSSEDEIRADDVIFTSFEFTDIVLGVAYNFSVVSINSEGVESAPAFERDVTAPLLQFTYQVTLTSAFTYLPVYDNSTSLEYRRLVDRVVLEIRTALTGALGLFNVEITHVFEGSVVIELVISSNNPTAMAEIYADAFNASRNHSVFATSLTSDLDACLRKPCPDNYTCSDTPTSHECKCTGGFALNGDSCEDVDECINSSSNNCHEFANCSNTIGSFDCNCRSGFEGDGKNCTDIEECLTEPCDPNATCDETPGSFTCACNSGYTGNGIDCDDINECDATPSPCHQNAICTNNNGSYTCTCVGGYSGDGTNCMNIDECIVSPGPCSENANCTDDEGSFSCSCNMGYTGTGINCTNINECEMANTCSPNATCHDTIGSFNCSCVDGYEGNGTFCKDVNECMSIPCDSDASCVNVEGSFECTCNNGYSGDGFTCMNINECTGVNPCQANATCADTEGSFTCTCNDGYTGDGSTCTNIDECATGNPCHANAMCDDTEGSYLCSCTKGYSGDGRQCEDVDECSSNPCHSNANCMNNIGSFGCSCKSGFSGNGFSCVNIDECSTPPVPCHNEARCDDTVGSHICTCMDGFTGDGLTCTEVPGCSSDSCSSNAFCSDINGLDTCICNVGYTGNGFDCENIDECSSNNGNCNSNAACMDTMGSFACRCNSGYTGTGQVCNDVDECRPDPCHSNATCSNSIGSFTCTCDAGFVGNGLICEGCTTISPCPQNASCVLDSSSPRCQCDLGFTGNETFCEDINECISSSCGGNENCVNNIGSFQCECATGYNRVGAGSPCVDTDECVEGLDNCHNTAICINSVGSFSCMCPIGFTGNGVDCVDVNECTEGIDNCVRNAICTNSNGNFSCHCETGFEGDGATECTGMSMLVQLEMNSTFVYTADLGDPTSEAYERFATLVLEQLRIKIQLNVSFSELAFFNGSVIVVLRIQLQESATLLQIITSYDDTKGESIFTGPPSTDVNSCFTATCGTNEDCVNIGGSGFSCNCRPGYFNTTGTCLRPANAFCDVSTSPVTCTCNSGFTGDGFDCNDIDECENSNIVCPNAMCTNTQGSFRCQCNPGTTNMTGNCIPQCTTDYCANGGTCTPSAEVGMPACICPSGFTGDRCLDSDTTRTLAIVFGVIAGVVLIAVIALTVYICKKRNASTFSIGKFA